MFFALGVNFVHFVPGMWAANRSRIPLRAENGTPAFATGTLPTELVAGVLAEPAQYQNRFLMGFVKHCGKRWISSDDTTESTQDSTREALVAACSSFIQRGDEEKTMWENYLNQELGGIIGDPFAFDLRIKILDNAARKALKRAARQAMMDEMLARSKAKRSMASSAS